MSVKLATALPKDDKNGLASVAGELADRYYSGERTTAIVVLESIADNRTKGDRIPEVKVARIEPLTGDMETAALDLMQEAVERRLGRRPETLDLSDPADEFSDVPPALAIEADIIDGEIVDDEDDGGDTA